jgi:hypothetical protein
MPDGQQDFNATVEAKGSRVSIPLPFQPSAVWGQKSRHHISGTVNGHKIRGPLGSEGDRFFLRLGQAWRRDNGVTAGDAVTVVLWPEGPQKETLAPDLAAALAAEPDARAFFEGLATFYRKGYVNWIEAAKRPETRARRISETIALLKEGRKQR